MPHVSRFKKRSSDRTGFDFFEIALVKEGPFKVAPNEYDNPPPSRKPLGGEGDIGAGDTRTAGDFADGVSALDTPVGSENPVYYITAAGGITPTLVHPFMQVAGSNGAVDITADPQIVTGKQNQVLTLYCVGSRITLDNGTGVALMGSAVCLLDSGDTITFMYTTGGSVWWETSRSKGYHP